jgi:hypothetical protein
LSERRNGEGKGRGSRGSWEEKGEAAEEKTRTTLTAGASGRTRDRGGLPVSSSSIHQIDDTWAGLFLSWRLPARPNFDRNNLFCQKVKQNSLTFWPNYFTGLTFFRGALRRDITLSMWCPCERSHRSRPTWRSRWCAPLTNRYGRACGAMGAAPHFEYVCAAQKV